MKLCDYRMGAGGGAVGRWSGGVVLLLCGHAAVIHFRSSGVLHQKCPIEGASAAANLTEEGAGGHLWTSQLVKNEGVNIRSLEAQRGERSKR